jgi:hypothetical protein
MAFIFTQVSWFRISLSLGLRPNFPEGFDASFFGSWNIKHPRE